MPGFAGLELPNMGDVKFYRVELPPELKPYQSEIDHALSYVDRHYPVERSDGAEKVIRYGGAKSHIPAVLFPDCVRVSHDGLHLDHATFGSASRFWPTSVPLSDNALSYDAIGLIFYMITRLEERDAGTLDQHERFISKNDAAVKRGFRDRPIVDEAAEVLATLICGHRPDTKSSFKLVLTHDVDKLKGYHRIWEPIRYSLGDVLKRGNPLASIYRIKAYFGNEPWRSFRDLASLSEELELRSRFYFMGPSQDSMDSPYALTMRDLLRQVSDEVLSRGHSIGFHPGYRTLRDRQEFHRQKVELEAIVGAEITEGRQHVLRYDCASTPALWDQEGMHEDFSLAYPDDIGFRNGACRTHKAYDLTARKPLGVDQTATCVTEFSMFDPRYQSLSVDEALEKSMRLASAVKSFGGKFVVLYHTGQPTGPCRQFYELLLRQLA
jgi:hypothetical protein